MTDEGIKPIFSEFTIHAPTIVIGTSKEAPVEESKGEVKDA